MLPAAVRRPELFAALIELEPTGCRALYDEGDVPALAGVPFLSVFGDYLEGTMWQPYADECRELAAKLGATGGTAWHVALADIGITGNSHMLMMEDNSAELADLLIRWLDDHGCCPPAP
jgi:hypothetical protein